MANRRTHIGVAMAIGGVLDTFIQIQSIRNGEQDEFNVGELIFASVLGVLGGATADLLEPATSSWHRKGFHSLGLGAIGIAASYHPRLKHTLVGRMMKVFATAHGSHLFLDMTTPRGLPWIHPKIDKAVGLKPLSFA